MAHVLDRFNMQNRTAFVTGGVGLLGSGFSRTLAQAGAAVAVADLDLMRARDLADEITADGGRALALQIDVTDAGSTRSAMAAAREAFGSLDVLVCSAAIDPKFDPHLGQNNQHRFEDFPLQLWQQAVDVNLTGAFLSAQAAAPHMLAGGQGVIVLIGSIYGLGGPDQRLYDSPDGPRQFKPPYYSATKAGLLGLTRYLAAYYAGKNIRVNALSPGGVFNDHDDDFNQAYSQRAMLGRMADKEELNAAMLFLSSDASSYMTGANLVVDGGWTAW
jgi:NAD(P)-dependent dehydrogenase (short-subunit alcohol dehydrogenase family)